MTADEIVDGILAREGGWRDQVTRPDGTLDPVTNLGITLDTLQTYGPSYLRAEGGYGIERLRALTREEAAILYTAVYISRPGFTPANIPFEPLRVQLIDFGVNSGPERAIRWLQRVLGMPKSEINGVLDPKTRERISVVVGDWFGFDDTRGRLVNDALVAARAYMIDQATDQGSMRKQDEEGVESRALSFFLARP